MARGYYIRQQKRDVLGTEHLEILSLESNISERCNEH